MNTMRIKNNKRPNNRRRVSSKEALPPRRPDKRVQSPVWRQPQVCRSLIAACYRQAVQTRRISALLRQWAGKITIRVTTSSLETTSKLRLKELKSRTVKTREHLVKQTIVMAAKEDLRKPSWPSVNNRKRVVQHLTIRYQPLKAWPTLAPSQQQQPQPQLSTTSPPPPARPTSTNRRHLPFSPPLNPAL